MEIEKLFKGKPLQQSMDFISSLNYEWKELTLEYIIKRFYKGNKNASKFINILVENKIILKRKGIVAGKTIINKLGNKVPIRGANSYCLPNPIDKENIFNDEVKTDTSILDKEWLDWNPKKVFKEQDIEDFDYGESDGLEGLIESIDV
jgi:hypothetical protein